MTRLLSSTLFLFSLLTHVLSLPCDLTNLFCFVAWNQQCPDEQLNTIVLDGTTYSFRNFDVLSFDDLSLASNGTIEGRAAVRNDFFAGDNVKIATQISVANGDLPLPFTLVVGRNINFPLDMSPPSGTVTCTSTDCLAQYFDKSRSYWIESSNRIASYSSNTQLSLSNNQLSITCLNSSSTLAFIQIDGSQLASARTFSVDSCTSQTMFLFNIIGSSDITYSASVPFNFGIGAIWNVIGSGRTFVAASEIYGYIINAQGSLLQTSGVIHGQIVAGNFNNVLNIARSDCPSSVAGLSGSISGGSNTGASGSSTPSSSGSNTGASGSTPSDTPTSTPTGSTTPYAECPITEEELRDACSGLSFELDGSSVSFVDYHVISFGNLQAGTGDVEGRVAVRGNFTVGNGFSVGAAIDTSSGGDRYTPFSLIASTATFPSGNLFPDGSSSSLKENAFIGGSSDFATYLESRITGVCGGGSDCLGSRFSDAHDCYSGYQGFLASQASTVSASIQQSQLVLTCSSNQDRYYVTVAASTISTITSYSLSNCQSSAEWIININATEDVYFRGASFPSDANKVLYNVIGSGRVVYTSIAISGSILAPDNYLNQPAGVIEGKVVVGDIIYMNQINKPDCPLLAINADSDSQSSSSHQLVPAFSAILLAIFAYF